jgi:catalase
VELGAFKVIQQALLEAGAITKVVAAHLGFVASSSGQQVPVDHTFLNMPSVMFDAVLVPGGAACAQALLKDGEAVHFVLEAFKHCKPLCLIGESVDILRTVGAVPADAAPAGVVIGTNEPTTRLQMAQDFIAALARHRHWGRQLVEQVPA